MPSRVGSPTGYPLPSEATTPDRAAWAPAPGQPLPKHYDGCFACGADHPDGLHLSATAGDGVTASATCDITGAHQGGPGVAHGGIVAAILDEAQGFVLMVVGVAAVTARLEVTYRRPVPVGTRTTTEARCTGVAGRKVFTVAVLRDEQGRVLAEGAGLFVVIQPEHFAPYLDRAVGEQAKHFAERAERSESTVRAWTSP